MESMPMVMWMVWGVCGVVLLGLLMYRSNLERYEEDAMFLGNTPGKHEYDQLIVKVKRVDPWVRLVGGAAGVLTFALAVFYMWDSIRQL